MNYDYTLDYLLTVAASVTEFITGGPVTAP